MSRLRKSLLGVAAAMAAIAVAATWIVGTQSGLHWLLARAAPYLPAELQIGEAHGSLLGGVTIDSLGWQDQATALTTGSVDVDFRLLPLLGRHLVVDGLTIDGVELVLGDGGDAATESGAFEVDLPLEITVDAATLRRLHVTRGDFDRSIDEITVAANLRGSRLALKRLTVGSAWLDLDVSGRVRLAENFPGTVAVGWQWKESESGPFVGQLRLDGDIDSYALGHSLAAPLAIDSTGTVGYASGSFSADLVHEWQALEWPLEERTLVSPRGRLRTTGTPEAMAVELDARAALDDEPVTDILLTGVVTPSGMQVSSFAADNPLARVAADGDVRWQPAREFDLRYSVADFDPATLAEPLGGNVTIEGVVQGVIHDAGPVIDLTIERLEGEINDSPVHGSGFVGFANEAVSLSDARLQLGANSLSVAGTYGPSLALQADIDAPDIADVFPDAAGAVRGRVSLQGTRDRPAAKFELSGTSVAWREYVVASFAARGDVTAAERGSADVQLSGVTAGGFEAAEVRLKLSGGVADHALEATLTAYNSELVLNAAGGYDRGVWSGQLTSLAVTSEVLERWATARASELTLAPGRFALSQTCLFGSGDTGKACLGGNVLAGGPTAFDLDVSDVPISALPFALPEGVTLQGYLQAGASGNWQDGRLSANADIALREAAVDAVYDEERVSLPLSEALATVVVVDNRVESELRIQLADDAATGAVQLTIDDVTDRRSAIAGRADVSIDDALLLAVVVPGITDPRGRIDGTMTAGGSLAAPEFLGEISLTGGAFGVRQAGIEVSEFDLRLSQMAPGELRLLGSARSGGGLLAIDGRTQIDAETGIRSEVRLYGEDFQLARLPNWKIAASPSIDLVLDDRAATVTGELVIPVADIKLKEIPATAQSPSPDAVVHREESAPPEPARRVDVDIRTVLGEGVRLSGFGLTTGLDGAVQIRGGTRSVYTGQGRLDLRDGRYKAYGQELEIERGQLIFSGPLDSPQLNVRAVRRVDDVVAGIEISGVPTQLQSTVFSEPAMRDAEVLSYLLTGRPLASATTAGEGDTLNNAAFALGVSGAGSITSQIRTELGLETLTIEGGADDGRLIAGKRFGERLLVEYGYGLIDKLGTLLLRYQLNERLVLESRTGTVSNLDVVYSVKKK